MHARRSWEGSAQPRPFFAGVTLRERLAEPAPHVAEHAPHLLHADVLHLGSLVAALVAALVGATVVSRRTQRTPVSEATVPAAHLRHAVRPSNGWYSPAAHAWHMPPYLLSLACAP